MDHGFLSAYPSDDGWLVIARTRFNFDRYSTIHDATLREFDHFIEQNTISFFAGTDRTCHLIEGRLTCLDGMYLQCRDRP